MDKCDRREISPLLGSYFPSMPALATSSDWHGFLNAQTGLSVALDEPNSTAFDKWRQALAQKGLPVWGYTQARVDEIAARGAVLLQQEALRVENEKATLARLAKEAPLVTAAELMQKTPSVHPLLK
jgi:hypothetical protein